MGMSKLIIYIQYFKYTRSVSQLTQQEIFGQGKKEQEFFTILKNMGKGTS